MSQPYPWLAGDQFTLVPHVEQVASFTPTASIEELAEETGVYSASPRFVRDNCGPLANQILDGVPQTFYDQAHDLGLWVNIDVRVHRLYAGDYPAYPGWHCDGEYRENFQSQPDLSKVAPHGHLVGTCSTSETGVSLTEFVTQPAQFTLTENLEDGKPLWGQVHEQVQQQQLATMQAHDGALYQFSSTTLHRAQPAHTRGWRLFVRVSMWHKPYLEGEGKISRQEQVYQITEGNGW